MHHERIEQLDYHLNQIIYLLKQPKKGRFAAFNVSKDYLYEKNWTLVIGTGRSGKTSFLQQTDLNVIQGQSEDNTDCNTWFSQEGVFIELPSLSLENPEENVLITHFLQAIKTHRRKKPFDNVLLTINMYSFIHEYDQYMEHLEKLKEQLRKTLNPYLSQKAGIYIIFTHMDRVAGFCDFFTEFSAQHNTHALGYLFDDYHSKKKLVDQHEKKYDRLLSRLHENLISLLHKTRNNLTRYLIREFPQQLESLRNMIRSSISLMAEINEPLLKVKGVFFTSACQSGICVDRITAPISQSYQLTLSNHFPQAYRTQPYFIKGIIKMLEKDYQPEDTRFAKYRREHRLAAYIGYAGAGFALLLMAIGYHYSAKHLNVAATALTHYQQLSKDNTLDALVPELHYLATASSTLNEMNTWFIPFKSLSKTKHWINTQYHKELSQQFLPQVAHLIEERLLSERDPAFQYFALKAYLMLGEPQYVDVSYLTHWLHHYLNLASESELVSSLLQPFPGIKLDQNIINQTRNNLNTLPIQHLTYIIIKNNPTDLIPINNDAFTFPASAKGIPNFYTRAGFEKQYTQTIFKAVKQIKQQNWILKNTEIAHQSINDLTHQIRELYLADYLNWWQLFVYHTQPKSFNTLDEAATYFKNFSTGTTSPFMKMLAFIQSNTRPFSHAHTAAQHVFNAQIAPQLTAINHVSSDSLQIAMPALNEVGRYFSIVAATADKQALVFNTARQKFMNPTQEGALNKLRIAAQSIPAPVGQWLQQISTHSFSLILSEAKNYINQQWKNSIIPEYSQNILNHFPINASVEQEISLDNFSHFFSKSGSLPLFFEEYIKPFLNTDKAQWSLKKVDGFEMPFRSDTILQLVRANVIREMFFPFNTEKPTIQFALQTTELQPIVGRILLNINGQVILASQSNKSSQSFNWPGDYTNTPVTLSIQNITGEEFQTTEYGPWGFFRLLSHANIHPIDNDTKKLQIVFDVNGSAAQYLLTASNPVNPFVPDIIQTFQLPNLLLS